MAGTIQTLIFTPLTTKSLFFRYRITRSPPSHSISLTSSVVSHRRSFISRPIRACDASNQKEGNGKKAKADQVSNSADGLLWARPLLSFASTNFLPLALLGGVALGLGCPSIGLTLRSADIGAAGEAWPVGLLGLISILLFTPYFSKIILHLQLQPQEFVTGLALFCCMPTTLSSGVALTQLAGGNSALALAMTVISNLLGILIIPFSISKFIASGVGVSVPTKQLLKSLVLTLLVPLILGKVVRESFRGLAEFVDQNRKLFSQISAVLLSLVPWMQVSRSRSLLLMVKPEVFLVAIGAGAVLHFIFLAFNILVIKSLSALSGGDQSIFAKEENSSAFVLVASQKTLPVMVAVVEKLGGAFGESGLLVLPCVAAHLNQIILDTFLVNFWARKDSSSKKLKPS
ncbi:probable sodium/metabolite cotransporter BASS4, chloroplastic isoform X2 [Humulus lupulus]|uniref:probable sodium/metabolite cotransporter BASS4, chloroplastic isoform X2 n=1 Tax=Humulus lupulus TaxID=3486 RepID=UPI002B40404C|nr:probable sodium/metabolite cotransporter BASS4, chloroplastic isoform X2 [Humulus lupulus]